MKQDIDIHNLQLDPENYRIGPQDGQPQAIKAIIKEQEDRLRILAEDIIANGLSPIELFMAVPSEGSTNQYVVVEGNRRAAAIKCVLRPQLAEGTMLEAAFKRLHEKHKDDVPQVIEDVAIFPSKQEGQLWIRRRHDRGLKGAGTEQWSSTARDRADADSGKFTPAKDVREFVVINATLDNELRDTIQSEKFNNTNLTRLLGTAHIKNSLGLETEDASFQSSKEQEWVLKVLTDLVTVVAKEEFQGKKFTEASISNVNQRQEFFDKITAQYPEPKKAPQSWAVTGGQRVGDPKATGGKGATSGPRTTPSTENRTKLIPRSFRLGGLPDGKIANVYKELKNLNVKTYPNAVAVLLRAFMEYSLDYYVDKHTLSPTSDKLVSKMTAVRDHLRDKMIMSKDELKPINVAISSPDALFSSNSLECFCT